MSSGVIGLRAHVRRQTDVGAVRADAGVRRCQRALHGVLEFDRAQRGESLHVQGVSSRNRLRQAYRGLAVRKRQNIDLHIAWNFWVSNRR